MVRLLSWTFPRNGSLGLSGQRTSEPLIFSRNLKRRFTNFFLLICNLLTWNHKFSERKKIRRLKRKIVERDTEIISIMVDLTRFFLSFFSTTFILLERVNLVLDHTWFWTKRFIYLPRHKLAPEFSIWFWTKNFY